MQNISPPVVREHHEIVPSSPLRSSSSLLLSNSALMRRPSFRALRCPGRSSSPAHSPVPFQGGLAHPHLLHLAPTTCLPSPPTPGAPLVRSAAHDLVRRCGR